MYINHITMASGHVSRIAAGDVTGETLARVGPWLEAMVAANNQSMPLPVSSLDSYTAHASVADGALVVTVSGPSGLPIWTMGVAARSRHAVSLWQSLARLSAVEALDMPSTPWAAVVLWPALAAHADAAHWSGDLERCIAWAWVSRGGKT